MDERGEKVGEKVETADVVIQGMGGLSRWDWPSIPGIHDFKVSVGTIQAIRKRSPANFGIALSGQETSFCSLHRGTRRTERQNRGSHWICKDFNTLHARSKHTALTLL